MTTPRNTLIAAVAALGLSIGLGACGSSSTTHPATGDVGRALTCTTDVSGSIRAGGTVVNRSSEASFYAIDVRIRVDGQEIGTHTATIESLDAGARRRFEVAEPTPPAGDATCEVTSVTRLAA